VQKNILKNSYANVFSVAPATGNTQVPMAAPPGFESEPGAVSHPATVTDSPEQRESRKSGWNGRGKGKLFNGQHRHTIPCTLNGTLAGQCNS